MENRPACLSRLLQKFEQLALAIDQPNRPRMVFAGTALLLLLFMFPTTWTGNEENYFQLSLRAHSPEKFFPFSAVFDHSKGRIVFEYLLGSLIDLVGYEFAHGIARIGMVLGYAAGLSVLFSALQLSCLDALLTLTVFRLCGEQLIGGEWLFQGVEAKTVAYALIIPALVLAVRFRWLAATLICVAATYLHFLVGSFWSAIILATHWLIAREHSATLKAGMLYGLLVMPLIYLIGLDQMGQPAEQGSMPSVARIYGEIRDPHHLAPFKSLWTFWEWMPGVVAMICLGLTLGILIQKKQTPPLALAPFMGLVYLMGALLISYLDRNNLVLAKLYLFRPSSLTLFLTVAVGVSLLRQPSSRQARLPLTLLAGSLVTVVAFQSLQVDTLAFLKGGQLGFEAALIAKIEESSAPGDIVLLEPYREMDAPYVRLHRTIPRPTLISWKFVPTNPAEILHWYRLIRQRETLFQKGCSHPMEARVALIVGFKPQSRAQLADCGPVIWQDQDVFLIKVATLDGEERTPLAETNPGRPAQPGF